MFDLRQVFLLQSSLTLTREVGQVEPALDQVVCLCKEVAHRVDVVRHLTPGLLTTRLPGVRRDQANPLHQHAPLAVVVPVLAGLAVLLLLKVRHLVHQRAQNVDQLTGHGGRVHGDLVGRITILAVGELLRPEVAVGLATSAQREDHRRQAIIEQAVVEEVEGTLQPVIGLLRGGLVVGHIDYSG